jgi:hypothetical protein
LGDDGEEESKRERREKAQRRRIRWLSLNNVNGQVRRK